MSDIRELIARFRQTGALIEFGGGDRVRFKPGGAPLPPGLLDELKSRKAEVIRALVGTSPVERTDFIPACPEFVGSRTVLRHPGFACGRCGNRYDRHSEAGKASPSADTLELLAALLRR